MTKKQGRVFAGCGYRALTMAWLAFGCLGLLLPANNAVAATGNVVITTNDAPQVPDTASTSTPQSNATNQLDDILDENNQTAEFIAADAATPEGGNETPPPKKFFSKLKFAPISYQLGGSIRYAQGKRTIDNEKPIDRKETRVLLLAQAQTYFIRRNVARLFINGQLDSLVTQEGKSSAKFNNLTGDVILNVFPDSRFPFQAALTQRRQLQGFSLFNAPKFLTTRLSLEQKYATPNLKDNYRIRYDQFQSSSFRSNQLTGDWRTARFKRQFVTVTGFVARDSSVGSSNRSNSLIATHRFDYTPEITINSLASLFDSKGSNNFSSQQLSTFSSWRPDSKPYSATGSARIFNTSNKIAGTTITTNGINANLSGSYRYSRYISMTGSTNLLFTETNGVRRQDLTVSGLISAGANNRFKYPLGSATFAGFQYTRDISVSLRANTSIAGTSNNTSNNSGVLTAQVTPSHQLTRNMKLFNGTMALSINQGLPSDVGIIKNRRSRQTLRMGLSHDFSAVWRDRRNSSVRLTAGDSRNILGARSSYQFINLQGSVRVGISRYSSLSGNITMQTTLQDTAVNKNIAQDRSSISLQYGHSRVFGKPNLVFSSVLQTGGNTLIPGQQSNNPSERINSAWKNRLSYSIGRTELGLDVEMAKIYNRRESLILFTLERKFGAMR